MYVPKSLAEALDILFEAAANTDVTRDEVDVQAIVNVDPDQRVDLTRALLPHICGYPIRFRLNSAGQREAMEAREQDARKAVAVVNYYKSMYKRPRVPNFSKRHKQGERKYADRMLPDGQDHDE